MFSANTQPLITNMLIRVSKTTILTATTNIQYTVLALIIHARTIVAATSLLRLLSERASYSRAFLIR